MSIKPDPAERILAVDDAWLLAEWERLSRWLADRTGQEASVEAILFLVGIQTRGSGFTDRLSKEHKQALIMEGTWRVFERAGLASIDEATGEWERIPAFPRLETALQEKLLRSAIVHYFADLYGAGRPTYDPS